MATHSESHIVVPATSRTTVERLIPLAKRLSNGDPIVLAVTPRLRADTVPNEVPPWLVQLADDALEDVPHEIRVAPAQSIAGGMRELLADVTNPLLLLPAEPVHLSTAEAGAYRELMARPPCRTAMLSGTFEADVETGLIVGDGPGASLSLDVGARLFAPSTTRLRLIAIAASASDVEEREQKELDMRDRAAEFIPGRLFDVEVARAPSREQAVLNALRDAPVDVVVLPMPKLGLIARLSRGTPPQRLIRSAGVPVIVVDEPEPPALVPLSRVWDRAYRWIPSLSEEEKVAAYMRLRRESRPDPDYYVLLILAAVIAAFGMVLDSPAVVIGAMLVAPLMSPVLASGLGVVQGDARLIGLSLGSLVRGVAWAVGVATVVVVMSPGVTLTGEVEARAEPGLLDLLVALGAGAAGAYAFARPRLSAALPGVAVAAALVPPLAALPVAVALGEWTTFWGALLLFASNTVAISAAAAVVFLWLGFKPNPDRVGRLTVFGRGAMGMLLLLAAMVVIMGALTARSLSELDTDRRVELALEGAIDGLAAGVTLDGFATRARGDALEITAEVWATQPLQPEDAEAVRRSLEAELERRVTLELDVTPRLLAGEGR